MTLIVADLLRTARFRSSTVLLLCILFGVIVFATAVQCGRTLSIRYSAVASTAANRAKVSRARKSSTRSLSTSALGLTADSRSAVLRILGAAEEPVLKCLSLIERKRKKSGTTFNSEDLAFGVLGHRPLKVVS